MLMLAEFLTSGAEKRKLCPDNRVRLCTWEYRDLILRLWPIGTELFGKA